MATSTPHPLTRTAGAAAAVAAHAFKGFADWIEVFRAGTHTDSKGRVCSFTEADLDQMAANVALGAPPAVLGHPKHNDPAYAWASEFKRDGAGLYAKFSDVNPAFEAGVASGAYRNRSVSIVKDPAAGWRVQHVGWLGAAPPAITGLKPVEFAADNDQAETHEFSADDLDAAWALGDVASLMRSLREWLIAKEGIEAADRVISTWRVENIAQSAERIRAAAIAEINAEANATEAGADAGGGGALQPMFTAHTPTPTDGADPMALTPEDLARTAAETEARVRAELTAQFTAQTAATTAELQRLQGERQAERIGVQIADWTGRGLVTPAEATGLREFMTAIEAGDQEFTFSAATDGSEVKQTRAAWFAQFMAGRQPVVKLGQRLADETGDAGSAAVDHNDAQAIASAAREFQAGEAKLGRTISIDQAVTRVMARAASTGG